MRPPIDIVIDADGMLHIEVNGCEGQSCERLTDALVQKMGTVEERNYKPEFYNTQGRPDYIDNGSEE